MWSTVWRSMTSAWEALAREPWARCANVTPDIIRQLRLSDALIGGAYYAFPLIATLWFLRARKLPFPSLAVLTAVFICACGTGHGLSVWASYGGDLSLSVAANWVTATVSWVAVLSLFVAYRQTGRIVIPDAAMPAMTAAAHSVRLVAAAILAVCSLIGVGILAYGDVYALTREIVARKVAYEQALAVERCANLACDAETGQRGYLLTGNRAYLAPYVSAAKLLKECGEAPWPDIEAKLAELAETIRLCETGHRDEALALVNSDLGKHVMDKIRVEAAERSQRIRSDIAVADRALERQSRRTMVLIPTVGVLAIGLAGGSMALVVRDSTRRVRAERAKAETDRRLAVAEAENRRAHEELARNSTFLNALSHDMRNPLNAIVWTIEEAKVSPGARRDPRLTSVLDRIGTQAAATAAQLESFLEAARAGRADEEPNITAFTLASAIGEAVKAAEEAARRKGVILTVECPEGCLVRTDRAKLVRILANLAGNAVKFTDRGRVTVTGDLVTGGSSLGGVRVEKSIAVAVADTGPGMTDEVRGRLFTDFFQGNSNPERDPSKGFGLGLSIAGRLAHSLGGKIQVESEVGKGSTFTVTLPDRKTEKGTTT